MTFELSRRRTLGLLAGIAAPTVVTAQTNKASADDFLASASATARAQYHADALAEAMAELHPEKSWRSAINHECHFCLVVGDARPVFVVREEA